MTAVAALPPPPPIERPRRTTIATAWVALASSMVFAGMVGLYLSFRSAALAGPEGVWLQDVSVPLTPPNVMMVTLLMSCVTIQWAHYGIVRNDRINSYVALGLSLVFGVAFINAQAWMYEQMALGVADSLQAVLIYSITGAHLLMLGGAMGYIVVTAFRALAGEFDPRQHDAVTAAALYWYVMVAVFAVIWLAIYITK